MPYEIDAHIDRRRIREEVRWIELRQLLQKRYGGLDRVSLYASFLVRSQLLDDHTESYHLDGLLSGIQDALCARLRAYRVEQHGRARTGQAVELEMARL